MFYKVYELFFAYFSECITEACCNEATVLQKNSSMLDLYTIFCTCAVGCALGAPHEHVCITALGFTVCKVRGNGLPPLPYYEDI